MTSQKLCKVCKIVKSTVMIYVSQSYLTSKTQYVCHLIFHIALTLTFQPLFFARIEFLFGQIGSFLPLKFSVKPATPQNTVRYSKSGSSVGVHEREMGAACFVMSHPPNPSCNISDRGFCILGFWDPPRAQF